MAAGLLRYGTGTLRAASEDNMADEINVRSIVKKFLIDNGYDGLCKYSQEYINDDPNFFGFQHQCSCGLDNLICCFDSGPEECLPGYKVPLAPQMDAEWDSRDGQLNHLDWYITTDKDARKLEWNTFEHQKMCPETMSDEMVKYIITDLEGSIIG